MQRVSLQKFGWEVDCVVLCEIMIVGLSIVDIRKDLSSEKFELLTDTF